MPVFRRVLAGALLLTLVLTALPAGPAARAQEDGTITIGVTDLATALDPAFAYDFNSWETLSHLYTGLTRQVPGTLTYEPALADSVSASADFLTWTFTLRPEAAFSDGTAITAQTLVDSIGRVVALDEAAAQAVTPYVQSVEAPAADRVVFHLKRPVPYFDALAALPPYFPQHPALLAETQALPYPDNLIGNGPYLLESFAPHQEIILRANPAYDLGAEPRTGTIILRAYARSQDLREALRKREIDLAWRALLLADLQMLARQEESLSLIDVPSTRAYYLYINHTLEPGDDPLVRGSLAVLFDRQRIVDSAYSGYATALTSMVPSLYPATYADLWPAGPDIPTVEELLLTAAYRPRGRSRLSFTISTSMAVYGSQIVTAAAEINRSSFTLTDYIDAGISTEMEATTFFSTLERGEGRLILFAWTPIVPHPDAYFRPLAHSAETIPTRGGYARAELDALLDQAATLADSAAQGERYRAAAALLLEENDILPLWQEHIQLLAWDDISGIQVEPNFFLHYDTLNRE